MNLTSITIQTDSTNPTNPINSKNPTNSKNPKLFVASKPQRVESSTQKLSDGKGQTNPTNPTNSMNSINTADTITPIGPTNPQNPLIPTAQAAEIQNRTPPITVAVTNQKAQLPPQPQSSTTPLQNDLATYTLKEPTNSMNSINPTNSIDHDDPMVQLAQYKPPSLLATEDEVRKFFDSYVERYNRTDIEGFLSLFSLKAIQNQKEGLEGIRKIYTNFFDQGREVRYRMQEMKIEIYQNAVEVRARYEIEQVLKIGGEKKFWKGQVRWVLGKENGSLKIISLNYQHQ